MLRADPREIVFTSGGTESINLAIKGAAWAGKARGNRIVTTAVEHRAVLDACARLEKFGFEVVRLPVDRYGRVDPDDLTQALTDRTILVSLQLANNEVGDDRAHRGAGVARVRAGLKALIHVDAVQAAPHMAIDARGAGHRPAVGGRPQARGAQGHGRAVAPPRAPRSCPRSMAAARSDIGARGPRMSPVPSGWPHAWQLADAERPETAERVSALA